MGSKARLVSQRVAAGMLSLTTRQIGFLWAVKEILGAQIDGELRIDADSIDAFKARPSYRKMHELLASLLNTREAAAYLNVTEIIFERVRALRGIDSGRYGSILLHRRKDLDTLKADPEILRWQFQPPQGWQTTAQLAEEWGCSEVAIGSRKWRQLDIADVQAGTPRKSLPPAGKMDYVVIGRLRYFHPDDARVAKAAFTVLTAPDKGEVDDYITVPAIASMLMRDSDTINLYSKKYGLPLISLGSRLVAKKVEFNAWLETNMELKDGRWEFKDVPIPAGRIHWTKVPALFGKPEGYYKRIRDRFKELDLEWHNGQLYLIEEQLIAIREKYWVLVGEEYQLIPGAHRAQRGTPQRRAGRIRKVVSEVELSDEQLAQIQHRREQETKRRRLVRQRKQQREAKRLRDEQRKKDREDAAARRVEAKRLRDEQKEQQRHARATRTKLLAFEEDNSGVATEVKSDQLDVRGSLSEDFPEIDITPDPHTEDDGDHVVDAL
ncbi:MAG: hypothetical protein IT290_00060, partial [Deltaproteobacteria bacterium]|nr:hypothetical protein [Deltaproteobacteria bacterium]